MMMRLDRCEACGHFEKSHDNENSRCDYRRCDCLKFVQPIPPITDAEELTLP